MNTLESGLDGLVGGLEDLGNGAAGVAMSAAEAVGTVTADVHSSFGGVVGVETIGNIKQDDGSDVLPESVVDMEEGHEPDVLAQ